MPLPSGFRFGMVDRCNRLANLSCRVRSTADWSGVAAQKPAGLDSGPALVLVRPESLDALIRAQSRRLRTSAYELLAD
jgi:hypothetical protein